MGPKQTRPLRQMIPDRHPDTTTVLDHVLWLGLMALVALAPLPLGSNRPLPAALAALAAGLLLSLWAINGLRGAPLSVSPARLRGPLILFAATCGWIIIQYLPLGFGDPIWSIAAQAIGEPLRARITVNPQATLTGLLHLVAYAAVFWLSLQLSRRPEMAMRGLKALTLIGGIYALYGLIIYLSGNKTLLFYQRWAYQGSLTSSFVNRNSYATFAGLCFLPTTLLLLTNIRQTLSLNWSLKRRLARLIEQLVQDYGWQTACFLLSLVALMLTGSRAGIASSALGFLVLGLFFLRNRSLRPTHLIAIAIGLAMLGALAWLLGAQTLKQRYKTDMIEMSGTIRHEMNLIGITALQSAPLTGTGYGTYPDIITAYRTDAISPLTRIDKAHNVYLENAIELGLPAALCLNAAIALLAYGCLKGALTRRRSWAMPALGVAATTLVALHSLVDFSLQIPAVSLLYAFIMGLAFSQSWSQPLPRRANDIPVSEA